MKILVCVSEVPDTTTKIVFNADGRSLDSSSVQFIINPYDELALTKALELTEAAGAGTVSVINVGLAKTEPTIRKCLAIGASDAVRINLEPTDAFAVANEIAAYAKDKRYDMIFTGRESIDYNGGQVGGMIAELLDLPSINVMTHITTSGTSATVTRDIDGGRETIGVNMPFVASAQKELTEPRIPNMRGIMMARSKPLVAIEPSTSQNKTEVVLHSSPPPRGECRYVDANNMDELVRLLSQEAKVI